MAGLEDDDTVETPEGEDAPETSILDAINGALAPTLPDAPTEETTEEGELDEEELEDETDEDSEDDPANAGRERGPDGKFLPAKADGAGKDAKGAPAVDAAGKLGADGKPLPVEPGKKVDPVNDPIPDEIKGRTRERMQSLISTVKTKDEQIAVQHQLVDSITSTGASPEEFGAMLGYMRWVHSDKPEDLKQAQQLLLSELEGISLKLGEAAPGINFLAKHPDLQQDVDNGQITQERAQEIALHRTRTANTEAQRTAVQTRESTAAAATAERNAGIAELNALGVSLNTTDPDYAEKHDILKPVLTALGELPPTKWKAAFQRAYNAITPEQVEARRGLMQRRGAAPAKPGAPAGKPLRANKTPSGGEPNRGPTSLLDAISAAVDSAG